MPSITYETENAVFYFDKTDTISRLNRYLSDHKIDEAVKTMNFVSNSPGDPIRIPDDYDHFGHIALDLIGKGKGLVQCRTRSKTYQSSQLKPFSIGL